MTARVGDGAGRWPARLWRESALGRLAGLTARVAPGWSARRLARPHFVIGTGRSGSTALRRALSGHPELAVYPGELNRLWHPRAYPWHRYRSEVPRFWEEPRRFTKLSLERRGQPDARRLRARFGAYQAVLGRPVLVGKSSMIQFMVPYVLELFPDARFVHLVRDGRAVALSYARRVAAGAAHQNPALDTILERVADYWRESVAEVERVSESAGLRRDGRLHELTYERLCSHPDEELTRLAAFLGVDPRPLLVSGAVAFEDRNWKSRQALGGEVMARLTEIMRPGLERHGYLGGEGDPEGESRQPG